jgi:regulator of protease activity HflC (stomatin/prohibitin superfamily)
MIVLGCILAVLVLWLIFANIVIVPQAHAYVVERLGKYKCTWEAGLHLKVPIIEHIVCKISLKEQVLDFAPQPVITKDNVTMQIDSVVFARVFDPKLYTYGVENPIAGLQNLSATTLRNIIGDMELDQTLTSRDTINGRMQSILDEATDPWGLKVTRVEIKNINPPKEIEEVMTKQMRAERERRQTVLEAQAHQEAVVSRAEGDKKAKILSAEAERDAQVALAEGRAKSITLVYEAEAEGIKKLNGAQISENVLKLKGLEALKDVSDGRATKIFMPSDITNAVASLGVAGEALGIGDATPIDKSPKPVPPLPKDPCVTSETGKGGREAAAATARINASVSRDEYRSDDEDAVKPVRRNR